MNWWWKQKNAFSGAKARHADKEHKYFTCKTCRTICRVPVGKGKIVITCPKCGKKRTLVYSITPFKIERKEKKVGALVAPQVKMQLEAAVTEVANDYKNGKGDEIPFSIHSVHNPKYAEKTKPQAHNNDVAFPVYKGVKIMYHRTVAELVRGFFLENELNGSISVKQ